jgi:hypothetical protein
VKRDARYRRVPFPFHSVPFCFNLGVNLGIFTGNDVHASNNRREAPDYHQQIKNLQILVRTVSVLPNWHWKHLLGRYPRLCRLPSRNAMPLPPPTAHHYLESWTDDHCPAGAGAGTRFGRPPFPNQPAATLPILALRLRHSIAAVAAPVIGPAAQSTT